jgi:anti-sigma factor RsiW
MVERLTCQALIEFLDDYVEERLTPSERRRFDEHLAVCAECIRYLKGYRATMGALTALGRADDAVPDDVPPGLVRAILAARRTAS